MICLRLSSHPSAELHYLPGIIWIPCGLRAREQLVVPLGNFFARMKVRHIAADVTGLRENGRTVDTTKGEVRNDALVIACRPCPATASARRPCSIC